MSTSLPKLPKQSFLTEDLPPSKLSSILSIETVPNNLFNFWATKTCKLKPVIVLRGACCSNFFFSERGSSLFK